MDWQSEAPCSEAGAFSLSLPATSDTGRGRQDAAYTGTQTFPKRLGIPSVAAPLPGLPRCVPHHIGSTTHHSLRHSFLQGLTWWAACSNARRRRSTAFRIFDTHGHSREMYITH